MPPTPPQAIGALVSINDAADLMGLEPFEIRRLIDRGVVRTVTLVEAASLPLETS